MLNMNEVVCEKSVSVHANGDIFIIPNRACKLDGFMEFAREKQRKYAEKLASDNDSSFSELADYFVETWICSDELQSDNIADHGFRINVNGTTYIVPGGQISRNILHHMIDVPEGDQVTINFNGLVGLNIDNREEKVNVNLSLTLTANQLAYRYRSFGNFHNVLARVCC